MHMLLAGPRTKGSSAKPCSLEFRCSQPYQGSTISGGSAVCLSHSYGVPIIVWASVQTHSLAVKKCPPLWSSAIASTVESEHNQPAHMKAFHGVHSLDSRNDLNSDCCRACGRGSL